MYEETIATLEQLEQAITEAAGRLKTIINTTRRQHSAPDNHTYTDDEYRAILKAIFEHPSGNIPDLTLKDIKKKIDELSDTYPPDTPVFIVGDEDGEYPLSLIRGEKDTIRLY